jgi:hypothetical protein
MLLFVFAGGPAPALAQTELGSPVGSDAQATAVMLSPAELGQLVAPIALYPDVLVAQILPAATFPTDVVMAARWVRSNPDMNQLDQKPWDESVKTLCHYPGVLFKLDEDLEWTNALGAAFLAQGDDVMAAIQAGRESAQSQGLLQTNQQQTIVVEDQTIRIVPTQTDVVYVPQYNPQVVYVDSGVSTGTIFATSAISFGTGFALGAWLDMDCNWHGHNVYYCQPSYWGGWPHRGTVAWGNGWAAGVGPHGGFAVGQDRGFVAGPRHGAAWGPNGAAVWHRPPVATPRPAYTGRYASYGNRYGGQAGGRNISNNQVNVNRNMNNVNIDRGNRTNIAGGSRTNVSGGNRTTAGAGDRPRQGPVQQPNRPATGGAVGRSPTTPSAFNSGSSGSQIGQYGQRGQQSRNVRSSGISPQRPSPSTPQAQAGRTPSQRPSSVSPQNRPASSSSQPRSSAFGSGQSGRQVQHYSNRGASSRGGGGGRSGGGRR